jgi:general secretion pathway protein N
MRVRTTMQQRSVSLILLLVAVLSVPASTMALSVAASDGELDPARRPDGPAVPSVWAPPAGAASVPIRPAAPPQVAAERAVSANPLWAIPLAVLSNTRERPIFSSSRRPLPPREAAVAVVRAPPPPRPPRIERPQLMLVGTIIGDDQSFGIFVDQTTKAALHLRLGEEYQGWRLQSVQEREVSLEREQQKSVLSLPAPGTEGAAKPVRMEAENATLDDKADPIQHGRRR